MPKANAKDVYYFSHDCNARNDDKILAMRSVYGLEGYAMFFMIVEILREQHEYKLKLTKYVWKTLAMQLGVEESRIKKFVDDCVNEFELLRIEDNFLLSESLVNRMNLFKEISEIRSQAAKKRWESQQQNKADEDAKMQNGCKCNVNAQQKNTSALQKDANKTKLNYTKLNYTKKEDINNNSAPDGDSFSNRTF